MHFEPIPAYRFLTDPNIPLGSRRFRAAYGGRGSAKSWEFTNAALFHTVANAGLRVAFLREVQANIKESSLELVRSRLDHYGLLANGYFREVDNSFEGRHGQKIMFMGLWKGNKPEGIKSLEGVGLTVLEEATEVTQRSIDVLIPTVMRTPRSEIWAIWNPRLDSDPIDKFFRGTERPPKSICVKINQDQNPHFPEAMREIMEADFVKDPLRAAWIWNGEYQPNVENAIWSRETLDRAWRIGQNIKEAANWRRVVIGVDPSGGGDDVGIIAAAETNDGAIILEDATAPATSPLGWATAVAKMSDKWGADCVVAERNFGGDMVESTLYAAGVKCRVKMVTASKGKHVRAEPVAGLYDQGLIAHYGQFASLEAEMLQTTPNGYMGKSSPNRLDAMVWAITELMLTPKNTFKIYT